MASAIILLPFYTDHLPAELFGAFWIYMAFSALIQVIVTFSFDTSIYVHFHEYKNEPSKLSSFVGSAFLLIAAIGVGVGLLLTLVGDYVFQIAFNDDRLSFYPLGLISVFLGMFQSMFKVYCSLLQTRKQPELFFRSNLLSFSLIVLFTIVGLYVFPNSLLGPLGGRLLAAVITGGWALFRISREFGFHFNYPLLRASFSFNFYSFVYQLQSWIMNYFDRILISWYLPLDQVGIYGFAMSCLQLIDFALNGLYTSFAPKIVELVTEQKEKGSTPEINRYFHGLTAAAMLLVSLCIFSFPIGIELFVKRADYQLAIPFIPFAGLIYLLKSMRLYFGIPYGVMKYTKPLPFIYMAVAAVKIGAILLLTSRFGIYGAILSSFLSYGTEVILLYVNGNDRFTFTFNKLKLLVAPLALVSVIVTVEGLLGYKFPLATHAFYMLACFVLLMWAFRNEVKLINPLKIIR